MCGKPLLYGLILAAMGPCLAANAAIIPDCAGSVEVARAQVVRVEKNGALILNDGRAVMLEGIRLSDEPQALAALRDMTQDGAITFTSTPPKEDRYDRIRAQGFGKVWIQVALLEKGLARVQIAPDRNECSPELYEAESRARAARAGLWASGAAQPRKSEQMSAETKGFQIVEGWVATVGGGGGYSFLDFGSDGQRHFTAIIAPADRRAFRDYDLDGLVAKHIRVRGIVQTYRGRPEIALSNPAQIEVLN